MTAPSFCPKPIHNLLREASTIALPKVLKPATFAESQPSTLTTHSNASVSIRGIDGVPFPGRYKKSAGERCSLSPDTRRSAHLPLSVAEVTTAFRNTAPNGGKHGTWPG
ncbi:hypothetical protein CEXT_464721 [Caerostris extrusa]|uniref:Uncharacterized protein n=1 Tax=Caerostris extrusa TaxID=172846 RepID=A0AAV4SB08_CAEEX|nr:hypothetical protein CEXT_464721 [Caerostris extrusa]